MSQITSGLRSFLSIPGVYNAAQVLMGASGGRASLVRDHVRPFDGACILDLGCGTADILSYLPEGTTYFGYDISEAYISAAMRRFGKRGYFFCGDFDRQTLEKLPSFDVVMALGFLHHLSDRSAIGFCRLAREVLKPGGRFITIDPCFSDDQSLIARSLIRLDRGQNVRTEDEYLSLVRSEFSTVDTFLEHRRWIPYTHLIMECVA